MLDLAPLPTKNELKTGRFDPGHGEF